MLTNAEPIVIPRSNFARLEAIIYVFGVNRHIWEHFDNFLEKEGFHEYEQPSLSSILCSLDLKPRIWELLELRYGFQRRLTFDEISNAFGGLTRSRVQQLEHKALAKINYKIGYVIALLRQIDIQVGQNWTLLQQAVSINDAVSLYQIVFTELGWAAPSGKQIRELLLVVRTLMQTKVYTIEKYLPNLAYAACFLTPVVLKNVRLAEEEEAKRFLEVEKVRVWRYEELAEAVLVESGEPLHYTDIINRAEKLERRNFISVKGMHNVLFSKQEKFALVKQGTYGLTSWGITSVETYTDIIAETLRLAQKPLPFGNVFQAVNAKRLAKHQTVQMTLDMHARFYCSQEGTYGLRAWLLPRDKQTLRTPRYLVETLQSFERVERSVERGCDVTEMISRDIAQYGD